MGPPPQETPVWHAVARLDELPTDGGGASIPVAGRQVAVFHVAGELFALDDSCPHRGGSLGLGVALDGDVTCPWHGFHFCLRTGRNTDGLDERVRVWPVRVRDGVVEVRTGEPVREAEGAK